MHGHYLDSFLFSRLHFFDQPAVCRASPLSLIVESFEYLWEILLHIFMNSFYNSSMLQGLQQEGLRDCLLLCLSPKHYSKVIIKTDCLWAKLFLYLELRCIWTKLSHNSDQVEANSFLIPVLFHLAWNNWRLIQLERKRIRRAVWDATLGI